MFSNVLEAVGQDRSEQATQTAASGFDAIRRGVKGGIIGTFVMTAFRIPITRSLPPTANFWAKYVAAGPPEEYTVQGIVLHLLYGTASGIAFILCCAPGGTGSDVTDEQQGILRGIAFGLFLSVFGERIVLKRLLDMDLEANEQLIFHVSHIIYGLTLGTWVGSNT
ncbi:hypothetical protein [Halocatena salina]|uniref:Uncharacterized protein n=1 Tax=Halocatena salina TaxID=2934340 RepID=A0A8U0A1R6_9EURY|nr:hypothetical protein [Halocatena salina]UPM42719.1 hypothetical protein MW046_12260 [Halocatena salina]